MKTAIYGAGAMGTALGVLMIKSGTAVDLFTRNTAHVTAARKNGLTLRCEADNVAFTVNAPIFTPDEMAERKEKYDLIFLMTKQKENGKIVAFLKDFLAEDGVIVTTQNGFPERGIAEIAGKERTFGCVCSFGANFASAGEAVLTSALKASKVCVGAYGEKAAFTDAAMKKIESVLLPIGKITGGEFYRKTENLRGARYSKLVLNAAFSGVSAATGMTFGEAAKNKKTKKIVIAAAREVIAVAEKDGVTIEKIQGRDIGKILKKGGCLKEAFLRIALPLFVKTHKNSVSGMLLDLKRGRKCEIDFITGAVSEAGRRLNVRTPYCDKITEIVHGIENGIYETSKENADFLLRPEKNFD